MFLFISSYWNGHYRMLVMDLYNARVQMGTLISQRSKGSLRKRNGWTHISGQKRTSIQGHRLQTGFFTLLSCVPYCSRVLSCFFYSYVLLYKFPCELPTALHVLVSLMSVGAAMDEAQVWYFSISQEQGKVQICPPCSPQRSPASRAKTGIAQSRRTSGRRSHQRLSSPIPCQVPLHTSLMCSFLVSLVIRHLKSPSSLPLQSLPWTPKSGLGALVSALPASCTSLSQQSSPQISQSVFLCVLHKKGHSRRARIMSVTSTALSPVECQATWDILIKQINEWDNVKVKEKVKERKTKQRNCF